MGRKPEQLANQPKLPELFKYIWIWFLELHSKEALSYVEIESWSRLTNISLLPQEVEVLRKLDSLYWQVINARSLTSGNQGK